MSELYLTDGTDRLDLLAANRGAKGGVAVVGMRLAHLDRTTGRAVESYDLAITAPTQGESIRYQQALVRRFEQARNYFADQAETPVWLVSRAQEESGARHAVIYDGFPDDYGDIYGQPFGGGQRATYTLTLQLERGPWLANPPLVPALASLTNATRWTPTGTAWASLLATTSNATYSFTNTTTGLCNDDAWAWAYSEDDGAHWTSFSTSENPSQTFADNSDRLIRLTATCTASSVSDDVIKAIP